MKIFLIAAIATCMSTGGMASDAGWFVVLASFRNPDGMTFDLPSIERIRRQAAECGLQPFNDHSAKFVGFAPGYDVHVVGAFESRSVAMTVAEQARPCVPGAYIKQGRYLGE